MGNQSPATESRHYEIHRAQDLRVRRERLLRDLRHQDADLRDFLAGIADSDGADVSPDELALIAEFFDSALDAPPAAAASPTSFHHFAFTARA